MDGEFKLDILENNTCSTYGQLLPIKHRIKLYNLPTDFASIILERMQAFCIKTKRRPSQALYEALAKAELDKLIKGE